MINRCTVIVHKVLSEAFTSNWSWFMVLTPVTLLLLNVYGCSAGKLSDIDLARDLFDR